MCQQFLTRVVKGHSYCMFNQNIEPCLRRVLGAFSLSCFNSVSSIMILAPKEKGWTGGMCSVGRSGVFLCVIVSECTWTLTILTRSANVDMQKITDIIMFI